MNRHVAFATGPSTVPPDTRGTRRELRRAIGLHAVTVFASNLCLSVPRTVLDELEMRARLARIAHAELRRAATSVRR